MCGLVGIASNNLILKDKQFFTNLLYIDQIRGEHSTGVCAVDNKQAVRLYKRALNAADFIQLKGYSAATTHADWLLMGHNRYATVGAKDDNNAHPFTHGHITLAHNGTLRSKHTINTDKASFATDSETVAYALSCDDYLEVLERLEGAFALTWYDKEDNSINFARNAERELYIGYIGGDLVWASEKPMLELIAGHMKKELKDVELLPVGQHRMYELGKLQEGCLLSKFVPKKPQRTTTTTTIGGRKTTYKAATDTTLVGTTVHAVIDTVRQSGYLEATTLTGKIVVCNVPKQDVTKWIDACLKGSEVVGKVMSVSSRWKVTGYVDCLALSTKNLILIDNVAKEDEKEVGTEKKCHACTLSITDDDPGEEHMGDVYHSSCLDYLSAYNYNYGGI